MTNLLRVVFGLQTRNAVPTTLTITGSPSLSTEKLVCTPLSGSPMSADGLAGVWTISLPPGDYEVALEAVTWIAGAVTITLDPGTGKHLPLLIRPVAGSSPLALLVWPAPAAPAVAATLDANAGQLGNPKDPWPPPVLVDNPSDFTLDPDVSSWHHARMVSAWTRTELQLQRAAPPTMPGMSGGLDVAPQVQRTQLPPKP